VDSCVCITVCVCVIASVTVAVRTLSSVVLPPSTATTEYEAGRLRSICLGTKGRALDISRNEESVRAVQALLDFIMD